MKNKNSMFSLVIGLGWIAYCVTLMLLHLGETITSTMTLDVAARSLFILLIPFLTGMGVGRGMTRTSNLDARYVNKPVQYNRYDGNLGDVFLRRDFIEQCQSGLFIDYDGTGYYATRPDNGAGYLETNVRAIPSDIMRGDIKSFPYVIWYNK